jgi:hypothetical protein
MATPLPCVVCGDPQTDLEFVSTVVHTQVYGPEKLTLRFGIPFCDRHSGKDIEPGQTSTMVLLEVE